MIDEVADYLAAWADGAGTVRVAVDGAIGVDPDGFAQRLVEPLRRRGRPTVQVRTDHFLRDASVRLEYGHTDEYALLHDWLDVAALRREVFDPLEPGGSNQILTSLRDPVTNRATREPPQPVAPNTVLLVSGQLLLGRSLPFDRVIRLSATAAALVRFTPPELAWTLPVVAEYEATVNPAALADIDVRLNDPRHPAMHVSS